MLERQTNQKDVVLLGELEGILENIDELDISHDLFEKAVGLINQIEDTIYLNELASKICKKNDWKLPLHNIVDIKPEQESFYEILEQIENRIDIIQNAWGNKVGNA